MPAELISRVHQLAQRNMDGLAFCNRDNRPYVSLSDGPDDPDTPNRIANEPPTFHPHHNQPHVSTSLSTPSANDPVNTSNSVYAPPSVVNNTSFPDDVAGVPIIKDPDADPNTQQRINTTAPTYLISQEWTRHHSLRRPFTPTPLMVRTIPLLSNHPLPPYNLLL